MVEEKPPLAPSQITITFPNGVSTTRAELQLSNVDTVQVEIAARFLERVADDQYQQAKSTPQHPRPGAGIMIPPPGSRI